MNMLMMDDDAGAMDERTAKALDRGYSLGPWSWAEAWPSCYGNPSHGTNASSR